MKLSLSPKSIKGFFVNHTEKVIVALIAFSLLVVGWNAFARSTLKTRPEDIMAKVDLARKKLETSQPDPAPPRQKTLWDKIRDRKIPDELVIQEKPFNPRFYPEREDDADPDFLPIVRLQGTYVVGPMAIKGGGIGPGPGAAAAFEPMLAPEPGTGVLSGEDDDEVTRPKTPARPASRVPLPAGTYGGMRGAYNFAGRRMVVLTGLVPVQQQQRLYDAAFTGKAPRPRREQREPVYPFYRIERREITPDGQGEWNKAFVGWTCTRGTWARGNEKIRQLARPIDEIFADWAKPAPPVVGAQYRDELLTMPLPPMLLTDWRENATHPEIPLLPVRSAPQPGDGLPENVARLAPGSRDSGPLPGAAMRPKTPEAPAPAPVRQPPVQYKLFRFVDFDVQPNHSYQYRVTAYAYNPNYDIPAKYLANDNQKRLKPIPMSKESEVVSVPTDDRILAGGVFVDPDDGPVASAKVVRWINAQGSDIISDYERKPRGSMLDQPTMKYRIVPDTQPVFESLPNKSSDIRTLATRGIMVVDAKGGQPISDETPRAAPGEVLLLTPEGKLIVRRQTEDAAPFAKRSMTGGNAPPVEEEPMPFDPEMIPGKGVGVVGGGRKPTPPRRRPAKPKPGTSILE